MYTLAVERNFVAQHFLVGGDWGPENILHSHGYRVEVHLQGDALNEHGFLADIVELDFHLNEMAAYFRDRTLNELAEFNGLNPSIEHFARIFWQLLAKRFNAPNIAALGVKVWEDNIAWASFHEKLA